MKISSFKYFVKEALVNVFKNGLMSFASMLTVASCVFILITSYNIAANISYSLNSFEEQIGLTAFINDSVTSDEIKALNSDLQTTEHVTSVIFISSEDAYENFAISLDGNTQILEGLPKESLLPRSFEILLDDNAYLDQVLRKLEQDTGEGKSYSYVRHAKQEIEIIDSLTNAIRIISIVLIIGLGFIGTVIIMNTIKITVNTRKNEITLMKYVGATDWFIRWPFIFEGIIIGLIGAIIPILITYFTYNSAINKLNSSLGFADSMFTFHTVSELFQYSTPLALALGIFIGVLGSVTSIRKYLNV